MSATNGSSGHTRTYSTTRRRQSGDLPPPPRPTHAANGHHQVRRPAGKTMSSGSADTVGALLASIANSLNDGLRILMFADKRQWGPDEFEQVRALEQALDEAKRDFQGLSPLVNGQFYYEKDRRIESLNELRVLSTKVDSHTQNFKDWLKSGGPINPIWARETVELRRELHRAQCRAAHRIFAADQEANSRCLGAFQVYRRLREFEVRKQDERERQAAPPWQQSSAQQGILRGEEGSDGRASDQDLTPVPPRRRRSLEDLIPNCNAVGKFERFGQTDIAFVCDFCDGHIVWEDIQTMPSVRTVPITPLDAQYPNWRATARRQTISEEKPIVFAPLVIANHLPPADGDWQARIWCPFCDDYTYYEQGEDEFEQTKYVQDDAGFPDTQSFQEHLEWQHTAIALPALPALPKATKSCSVM